MSDPRTTIAGVLDLVKIRPNTYLGPRREGSRMARVFGGQLLSQALLAACRTAPVTHRLHSMHAYFLRGADADRTVLFEVELLRDGRSFATRMVTGRQADVEVIRVMASFFVGDEGPSWDVEMAAVPPPDACPPIEQVLAEQDNYLTPWWELEWSPALEFRLAPSDGSFGQRVWFRYKDAIPHDDYAQRAAALAYASDLTILGASIRPLDILIGSPDLERASLDHAMWFHRDPPAMGWMLYDQASPGVQRALGLGTARVFDEDGTLLASVAQQGMIRHAADQQHRTVHGV